MSVSEARAMGVGLGLAFVVGVSVAGGASVLRLRDLRDVEGEAREYLVVMRVWWD